MRRTKGGVNMGFTEYINNMFKQKEDILPPPEIKLDETIRRLGERENTMKSSNNYIWVDGYKGTDADMSCTHTEYKNYYGILDGDSIVYRQQYELGVAASIQGEPELCSNGFHFCLDMKNVLAYYPYDFEHRFFKVRALVREADFEKCAVGLRNKCVAKTIVLTEEITLEFKDLISDEEYFYYGDVRVTEKMFEDITVGHLYANPMEALKADAKQHLLNYGYKEKFVDYLLKNAKSSHCYEIMELSTALFVQEAGNDTSIYLLLRAAGCVPY